MLGWLKKKLGRLLAVLLGRVIYLNELKPLEAQVGELKPWNPPKKYIILWKLGNLEHRIAPTETRVKQFIEALKAGGDSKFHHLVWDAAIDVRVLTFENDAPISHEVVAEPEIAPAV